MDIEAASRAATPQTFVVRVQSAAGLWWILFSYVDGARRLHRFRTTKDAEAFAGQSLGRTGYRWTVEPYVPGMAEQSS